MTDPNQPTKKMVVIRSYSCGDYNKIERIRTIDVPINITPEMERRLAMVHGGNALSEAY